MFFVDSKPRVFLEYVQYLTPTFVICFVGLIFLRTFTTFRNMGEIDTKPIESVQTALSFFGEKGDHQRKNWSPGSNVRSFVSIAKFGPSSRRIIGVGTNNFFTILFLMLEVLNINFNVYS